MMQDKQTLFKVITDLILYLAKSDNDTIGDDDMIAQVENAVSELITLPLETMNDFRNFLKSYRESSTNIYVSGIDSLLEALDD